jgi:hypothetical protein
LQGKNWARQYTPGAILGVYSAAEFALEPRTEAHGSAHLIDTDPRPPNCSHRRRSRRAGKDVWGFEPAARDRRACLYHEADLPRMRAALIKHLEAVQSHQAA